MRIAQVSPLYESCPPRLYGGTERVVSYLTEELVRQGHEVTLFASGDSQTNGILKAPCDRRCVSVPSARIRSYIILYRSIAWRAAQMLST
jgi:hypothetical protein